MNEKYTPTNRLFENQSNPVISVKLFNSNRKNIINRIIFFFILFLTYTIAVANSIVVNSLSTASGCSGSAASVGITFSCSGTYFPGNIFTAELSDQNGDFTNAVNIGSINSPFAAQINASIPANLPGGSGYMIRVTGSVNSAGINQHITVSKNSLPYTVIASVTPSVSISVSGGTNPACQGAAVTFTATSVNGGSSPMYQWKINGINSGANSSTFSSSAFANGDVISCDLTSDAICPFPALVSSNSISMTINSCAGITRLNASSCGAVNLSMTSYIYCNAVAGATDYAFTISNSNLGYSVQKFRGTNAANIRLTAFPGLMYGETYNVTVQAKVGGVLSAAGQVCQITLRAFPPTSLNSVSCGATNLTLNSYIYCTAVSGASDYEFTITNSNLGYSQVKYRGSSASNIKLVNIPGLMYGETYDVAVKAKVSGVWGPTGSVCQITLRPFPETSLNATSCGASGLSATAYIYCFAVAGATDYEFTVSNMALGYSQTKLRGSGNPNIRLTNFSGLTAGATYDVIVKAKAGGVWGPEGSVCQITLAGAALAGPAPGDRSFEEVTTGEKNEPGKLKVYPNPLSNTSTLFVECNGTNEQILISDVMGRVLSEKTSVYGSVTEIDLAELNLSPGVYNVSRNTAENKRFYKVLITR
jgi:hypothetical protein